MSAHSRFNYGSYGASNTNSGLFKVALAMGGFFTGALVGAFLPDLILAPSTAPSPSSSSPSPDTTADAAPLCGGPECASLPPPKLPSTSIPLAPPSPYESSRLTAVRASASSSATIGDLEVYALLLHLLHTHTPPSSPLYSDPAESTPALVRYLSSHAYDVSTSSGLTLSALRSLVAAGALPLARLQVGGEGRWVGVCGIDAFYVYALDLYTPNAVVYVPTREFTRAWWEMDGDGRKQSGVAMIVKRTAAPSNNTAAPPAMPAGVQLTQLQLEAAADEHPAVEVASL